MAMTVDGLQLSLGDRVCVVRNCHCHSYGGMFNNKQRCMVLKFVFSSFFSYFSGSGDAEEVGESRNEEVAGCRRDSGEEGSRFGLGLSRNKYKYSPLCNLPCYLVCNFLLFWFKYVVLLVFVWQITKSICCASVFVFSFFV